MSTSESGGGVRAQAILMIVVVFLVGAFAGGAFERMSHRGGRGMGGPGSGRMWGGGRGGPGGPGAGGPSRLPPGYEQLGLSDLQRAKLDSAFNRRRPRIDSLMKATWAVVQPAMDSTRSEVNAILTAEQRTKLDSLRRSFRGRGGRNRSEGGADSSHRP